MRRVEEDGDWSLMCPAECPGLADCWGPRFDELYESYERKGKKQHYTNHSHVHTYAHDFYSHTYERSHAHMNSHLHTRRITTYISSNNITPPFT